MTFFLYVPDEVLTNWSLSIRRIQAIFCRQRQEPRMFLLNLPW